MTGVNFTRKQVGSLTLGERLRKMRNDRRLSLSEVSRATRIQARYLEAIENGEYEKLPAEVYVKGFLRSYAAYLDVPEDAILRLYDRECSIQKNLGNVETPRLQPKIPIAFSFSLSPKSLITGAILVIAFGFFAYLYSEYDAFVSEPRLVILEPMQGAIIKGSETTIRGETDARAIVMLNGEPVVIDESGHFSLTVQLQPGLNTFLVTSTNRFGKERQEEVTVRADFEQHVVSGELSSLALESPIALSVRAVEKVSISVEADGVVIFSGALASGEEKRFDAKDMLIVSSESGLDTLVRFGSGNEEPLSDVRAPIEIRFDRNGRVTE